MWFTIPKSTSYAPTLTGEKSHEANVQNRRMLGIQQAICEAQITVIEGKPQPTGYRRFTKEESTSIAQTSLPALHYREPPTVTRDFHPQEGGAVVVAYGVVPTFASFTWPQSLLSHLITALVGAWKE